MSKYFSNERNSKVWKGNKGNFFSLDFTFLGWKIGTNLVILYEQKGIKLIQEAFGAQKFPMGQRTFKNVNNCLNTNIYSYLEISSGQSSIYI